MELMGMKHLLLCLAGVMCGLQAVADVPPRDRLLGKQGKAWVEQGGDPSQYDYSAYREADDLSGWGYSHWSAVKRTASQATAALKSKGSPRIPVILVQFTDLRFSVRDTDSDLCDYYSLFFNGRMDGTLYDVSGGYGSVRDYFVQQSDSLFMPEFVVVGTVTLGNGYAYYGRNANGVRDANINEFYQEAATGATALWDDWSRFDNDGDGMVETVVIVYAGEGENAFTDPNTIWPKEKRMEKTYGGVDFDDFVVCNEMYGEKGDGIGVICHELSHSMGLPDLYDTASGGTGYGLDYWDVMDSGNYNKNGYWPCGYSCYEKEFMGWTTLETLEYNKEYELELLPMSEGGKGYKIVNPENEKEYYILENRQNTGWDKYIARSTNSHKSHGLLVTHVDYNYYRWQAGKVNASNYDHQGVSIVPADDELLSFNSIEQTEEGLAQWRESVQGDPFPGLTGRTSLLSGSQPIYTASGYLRQPITCIVEHEDGRITLTVCRFADVDANGLVDTQDALKVYDRIRSSDTASPYEPEDVNTDGTVDTQDVLRVYEYMRGQ